MTLWLLSSFALLGAVAGVLSGLLGIGGGLVVVPTLIQVLQNQVDSAQLIPLATGTSLAAMVCTTAVASLKHAQRQAIAYKMVGCVLPGLFVGTLVTRYLMLCWQPTLLRAVFTLGLIGLAVLLWRRGNQVPTAQAAIPAAAALPIKLTATWQLGVLGVGVGAVAAVLGIGGGLLWVPALVQLSVPVHQAIGSSALLGLATGLVGSASAISSGWQQMTMARCLGFVHCEIALVIGLFGALCAPLGVQLSHRLPAQRLLRGFALLLASVALWQAIVMVV